MARQLTFTTAEARQYEFAYQSLQFPAKQLNRQEERSLARLLDGFETIGEAKALTVNGERMGSYKLSAEGDHTLTIEEADFALLKELLNASQANGMWVRDKLALVDRLEKPETPA